MTTPGGPDFVLGMAEELRPSVSKMSGAPGTAISYTGHAVTPANVREGEHASRAVCAQMTTVADPQRSYYPGRGGASHRECRACSQHVAAAR